MKSNKSKPDHENGKLDPAKRVIVTDLPAKYASEKAKHMKTVGKTLQNSDKHQVKAGEQVKD